MKRFIKSVLSLFLIAVMCLLCVACNNGTDDKSVWDSATYFEDTTFGDGSKKVLVEVIAEEKSVTFTVNTDKGQLGDALLEYDLIAGEEGPYGLYVKKVNGITADYDIDQTYWALTKNGESVLSGVDGTDISDGEHYELVYTK